MYRKKSRGWYKHKDFILIDLACLFMALILAYLIRNGSVRNLFTLGIYRNVMIFVILVDLFLIILFESYKGVLRRGRYQELRSVIRQMILIELASGLYLFTVSGGHAFSRIILYLMGIFYVLLSYCTRIIWKKRLLHKMAEGGEHSLYIVTNYDLASKVIQNVKEHNYNRYNINGLILIDKDMTGKEIAGVPVVADLNNASSFICQQWVDEVFVNVDETYPYPQELIEELLEMGMPVHVNLAKVRSTPGQKQFVEAIGGYTVLTTTMNYATDRQALAKRVLDILGGLVGCFLTGIIFIFIAPAIYISSPGPIFFSQTRIGKNGKPFKMYKFRSMYMDAEERKAELMAQNKMSDGRMFKLDFDPRVIGNKILPDGTRKTGIGEFIRKTSLDEFPQFWNVLNGTMSLVGTRPILQDELRQYELHHRARIAIKPGITGMWQVSGRSDITDFEEVVRLDTEYISKAMNEKERQETKAGLKRFIAEDQINEILECVDSSQYNLIDLERAHQLLKKKTSNVADNLHYKVFDLKRRFERIVHPTGLFIVLLGVDGAGKTTIAENLKARYVTAFRKIDHYHSRVRVLKDISQLKKDATPIDASNPHGKKQKAGKFTSVAKFGYYFLDFLIGNVKIAIAKIKSTLVLVERYYYDYSIDKVRYNLNLSDKFLSFFEHFVLKPDVIFILTGDSKKLLDRKHEITIDEIDEQKRKLNERFINNPKAVFIDTTEGQLNSMHKILI